jgi:hypothetical protein
MANRRWQVDRRLRFRLIARLVPKFLQQLINKPELLALAIGRDVW